MMPAGNVTQSLTRVWLEELYGDAPGWLTLFTHNHTNGNQHVQWRPTTQLDELACDAQRLSEHSSVWFGVATRRERLDHGRGRAEDCQTIPGLWLDIDVAGPNHKGSQPLPATQTQALNLLTSFPMPPTAIVNTGGGLQAWWLFHEHLAADPTAAELLARWGYTWAEHARVHGWHVDNVFDIARVMRLPGTVNRKTVPTTVTVIHADYTCRYNPDDLDQHTIDPPQPQRTPIDQVPYIGPERPGDALNTAVRGGDLLAKVGFQLHHRDSDGSEHWTGPWKDRRQGSSATVYADGHTTIWSDSALATWPHLELRRPYDPFGLYTQLFSGGDWRAATKQLAEQGYGTRPVDTFEWVGLQTPPAPAQGAPPDQEGDDLLPVAVRRHLAAYVNWATFWKRDRNESDWLAEPFLARGRGHALYAPAKTGKSLLGLYVAAGIASGHPIFNQAAGPPVHVLYIDLEMTEDDLQERIEEMGYGPTVDLDHLHYYVLPSLYPLDRVDGGTEIVEIARHHQAELVIIDTTSRAISGPENDADTLRALYAHTGRPLKADGRALLRLDHSGKDLERGQRGTSAKADDVDVVWRLTSRDKGRYRLDATHRRMSWVPASLDLEQSDNPLRYRIVHGSYAAGTQELAALLDELGAPVEITTRGASDLLKEAGQGKNNTLVTQAVRWRKEAAERITDGLVLPGSALGSAILKLSGTTSGSERKNAL